jgi:putative phosphoribosyl transferase
MTYASPVRVDEQLVDVRVGTFTLEGQLVVPRNAQALVVFAYDTGNSRHSPRNQAVTESMHGAALGTLSLDLLTPNEAAIDRRTGDLRHDVGLLAERLVAAVDWLAGYPPTRRLDVGLLGDGVGAAAALVAAADRPESIKAIVCRSGRPDLAGPAIQRVQAPVLFLVGGDDIPTIGLNQFAYDQLTAPKKLDIISGASHKFQEPGKLESAARRARDWFEEHLAQQDLP